MTVDEAIICADIFVDELPEFLKCRPDIKCFIKQQCPLFHGFIQKIELEEMRELFHLFYTLVIKYISTKLAATTGIELEDIFERLEAELGFRNKKPGLSIEEEEVLRHLFEGFDS